MLEDVYGQSWLESFSEENIKYVFRKYIFPRRGQGIDRNSVDLFNRDIEKNVPIISRKCISGTYKFSPYLEQLQSKGRNKPPRVVSIATIRDKIVLKILTNYIHQHFNDFLARDLPNTVIRKIKTELNKSEEVSYIKLDLENFYGSINHDMLLKKISDRNNYKPFIRLIRKAIVNPTLPANYSVKQRKEEKATVGVPQGLSVSNILAEIFIKGFDDKIKPCASSYFRFVDDIIIFSSANKIDSIWKNILEASQDIGVKLSEKKSTPIGASYKIEEGVEFLGYKFLGKTVSVRDSSYRKFLESIIGKISKFKHEFVKLSESEKNLKKAAFIQDLNERITGAIDQNKKYGWIFFFSEINDLQRLSEIDSIVSNLIEKSKIFSNEEAKVIKKIRRSYFEANYSPQRGYIHNYNDYDSISKKIKYLILVGFLNESDESRYRMEDINLWFEQVKSRNLLKLEHDVSTFS